MGLRAGGLFGAGLLLAGCSLPLPRLGTGGTPADTNTSGAFQSNPIPGSIWKSEDGGKTFEPRIDVGEQGKITTADVLAISFLEKKPDDPTPPTSVPAVYVGTAGTGIFRSENGGQEWEHIPFPPQKIYSFIVDRSDANRMFATGVIGKRGKLFRTTDAGETWQDMYSEPGLETVILSLSQHPRDTNVIFSGTSTGTVIKSTDKGDTWLNVGQRINGPVTEIIFDATKPRTVYALAFRQKLWYSENGGVEWIDWEEIKKKEQKECRERERESGVKRPAGEPSPCEKITDPKRAMPKGIVTVLADPIRSGRLLAGTGSGLYESTDHGKYWGELNIIESARKFPIRAIGISPKNGQEIVFVAGRAFYKSINNGQTWAVVQLNVDRDISNLQYDLFNPDILYLGLRKF